MHLRENLGKKVIRALEDGVSTKEKTKKGWIVTSRKKSWREAAQKNRDVIDRQNEKSTQKKKKGKSENGVGGWWWEDYSGKKGGGGRGRRRIGLGRTLGGDRVMNLHREWKRRHEGWGAEGEKRRARGGGAGGVG